MTPRQEKAAIGAGLGLTAFLVWWLWPKKATASSGGARVKAEYNIDDNVNSPDFGLPVYGPPAPVKDIADNPEVQRLIDVSNAAIAADDAANKG